MDQFCTWRGDESKLSEKRHNILWDKVPTSEWSPTRWGRRAPTISEESLSSEGYSKGSNALYKPPPPSQRILKKGAKTVEKRDEIRVQKKISLNATYLLELVLGYENSKVREYLEDYITKNMQEV